MLNTEETRQTKDEFEKWIKARFPHNSIPELTKDGYNEPLVNAMWIGFNAGKVFAIGHFF